MRRTKVASVLLLAIVLGYLASNQSERAVAQETLSPARTKKFLADANPLLEHMVKDLASRCSLSDEEQEQLIGALRFRAAACGATDLVGVRSYVQDGRLRASGVALERPEDSDT